MEKTLNDFIPLDEGVNDPGIFKAIFLAGGPGSGKSFIVGRTALPALGLKVINSDQAFELALKKADMTPDPENIFSDKGQSIRARAKALTQKRMDLALAGRLGVVIDGTGKNYQKIQSQKQQLEALGYETMLLFVNTDLETAQERNNARARTLPDSSVHKMWQEVQNNIGKFQNLFGHNMLIVDNSSGVNADATTLSAYRKVSAWIRQQPQNYLAKRWMKSQQNRKLHESLKDWFGKGAKGDWVRMDTKGEIKGPCAREPGEGKPKCLPRQKAHSMDKKERASAARRKRREDPVADRAGKGGKPVMVSTEESIDEKCWDGYKQVGTKKKGKKIVPNCVPEETSPKTRKVDLYRAYSQGMKMIAGTPAHKAHLEKIKQMRKDLGMKEELEPLGKLSKLKPVKSPEQRALSKDREKHKVFKNISIGEAIELLEKSKPTNPELWARAKSAAKSKFDVYPSAYANGWAVQWYKKRGGGWKSVKEATDLEEVTIPMRDRVLAKTVYKQKYEKAAKILKNVLARKRKERGQAPLKHDPIYYAGEIIRQSSGFDKLNAKIILQMTEEMIAEETYSPQKHEWGKDEGTKYYKRLTPGQSEEETKDVKPIKTPVAEAIRRPGKSTGYGLYKSPAHKRLQGFLDKKQAQADFWKKAAEKNTKTEEVNEENGVECQDGHYYCRQRKACVPIPAGYKDRGDGFIVKESVLDAEFLQYIHQVEVHGFSETDVQEMERDIDQMSFDDMIALGMYDDDELEEVDVDQDGDYDILDDVEITEVLSIQGRMKRRFNARRNRQKLKVARMRRSRMASDPGRIKMRAARGARNMMKKRLARGRDISSMPPAEKNRLENLVKRFAPIVSKLAQRMIPQVRRAEVSRLAKRGGMKSQKAKKFVVKKAGSASKYKAKKFKIKKK